MPDSIIALGSYAFYGFDAITTLNLPSVKSFVYTSGTTISDGYVSSAINYCSKLKTVMLPKVSNISGIRYNGRFNGLCNTCSSLNYVVLGSKEYPFTNFSQEDAYGLSYGHFRDSNKIDSIFFVTKNGLREDVTFISGGYGFANESRYKFVSEDISFSETEEYSYQIIGNEATIVAYTGTATEIEIPSTVNEATITSIGNSVFYNSSVRTEITSVNLPNTVTSLGSNCFNGCSNLTSIEIPNVTSFGNSCFNGCSSLTSIELPSATSLDNQCFYYCTNLTEINLPLVISLGNYCFYGCSNLASINIPNATSLGSSCFYYCSNLPSIKLPSVTSIGGNCFNNCPKLGSVVFGDVGKAITDTSGFGAICFPSSLPYLTIYVSDQSNPPTLTGSPWGATSATIIFEQA